MNEKNHNLIKWELRSFPMDVLSFIFLLLIISPIAGLFIIILTLIIILNIYISLLIVVLIVALLSFPCSLFSFSQFRNYFFIIQLREKTLFFKRGFLFSSKKYLLSPIYYIEIKYHKFKLMQQGNTDASQNVYASLESELLIKICKSNKEKPKLYRLNKNFEFKGPIRINSVYYTAKVLLESKLKEFENHLKSLQELFPNLIRFTSEEIPVHRSPFFKKYYRTPSFFISLIGLFSGIIFLLYIFLL